MKILKISIYIFSAFFLGSHVFGQNTLDEKYQNMIETTESYNQYKMIPRTTIDGFWSEVQDSLRSNNAKVRNLNSRIQDQKTSIDNLTSEEAEIQSKLDKSLKLNDSILFFGIELTKMVYHIIVWGLIIILVVAAIMFYTMFHKSNRVTVRSKKELETMQLAFEKHKTQSRETQVKLKRELQTAINMMDEMKRGRN